MFSSQIYCVTFVNHRCTGGFTYFALHFIHATFCIEPRTMKREAFKMYLKPGCEAEYEKRHAAIWPELKALLSQNGVSDYSIYWDKETNILFAFQKTEGGAGSQDLGNTEIVQKWWDYMADIMEVNPDNSPVSIPLPEVFHMD